MGIVRVRIILDELFEIAIAGSFDLDSPGWGGCPYEKVLV